MKKMRGLGLVFERGSIWWVQYNFRGKRYRESSESANRADAVKLLKKRLSEIGKGRLIGPVQEKVTFHDLTTMLVNDYRTHSRKSTDRAEQSIKRLKEFFSEYRALDITTDRITTYIQARQEQNIKSSTIRNELAALKRMFNLAIQAERLDHRPHIPSLKVSNARTGFFEEADFKAVLAYLPDDIKPVVEFSYLTGWRAKSEVLPIQWRQVDFEAGTVRLDPGTTKNDEGRVFPFTALPALSDLLKRQRERTTAIEKATDTIIPWIFHREGQRILDFRGAWEKAREAAGLPEKILHDFRRTAVRNLERAGVSRSVAMKLTGHKTESVYRRYAIVCEADLSEGVKKLAALHKKAVNSPPSRAVIPLPGRSATKVPQSNTISGYQPNPENAVSAGNHECRGRDSNSHGPCDPRDFKSRVSTIPPPRRVAWLFRAIDGSL